MNKTLLCISIGIILFSSLSLAQTRAKAFEAGSADTTYIAVNQSAGWQFVSPYLSHVDNDSVRIEMILQHDRSIDWKQKQLVGRITRRNLWPVSKQELVLNLLVCRFRIYIDPDGNCYLQHTSGELPGDNPLAIPVRAVYSLK